MSDRLLNLDEASKYLGIAKPTIYLYARTGKIPALKVGYLWKFDKDDLKNHLKKQMKSYYAKRKNKTKEWELVYGKHKKGTRSR